MMLVGPLYKNLKYVWISKLFLSFLLNKLYLLIIWTTFLRDFPCDFILLKKLFGQFFSLANKTVIYKTVKIFKTKKFYLLFKQLQLQQLLLVFSLFYLQFE